LRGHNGGVEDVAVGARDFVSPAQCESHDHQPWFGLSLSVVIGSGKMGYVYEMNAGTGKLIWQTPVGEQNGTEGDSLKLLEHRIALKVR
jgi:outer membrane protein assembly factor BamB